MSQDSYNLKLVGYSESEKETIGSILSLAERGLFKKWRIVETPPVDYFLLPGDLITRMEHDNVLKSIPIDRCIFSAKDEQNSIKTHLRLQVDARNVPRIRSLIELFNQLCEKPFSGHFKQAPNYDPNETGKVSQNATDGATLAANESHVFSPDFGFVGKLLSCANTKGVFVFELDSEQKLSPFYVEPEKQLYYSSYEIEKLGSFFSASPERILCKPLGESSVGKIDDLIESQKLTPATLRSLIWYSVFKSSGGRLLRGTSPTDVVRLKHWPDLNFPEYQDLVKIAAFMQSNAVDLTTIAEKTAVSIDQVYNFYNACEVVGLIEHTKEMDIHSKTLNPEKVGLLAKIRERLNKGN
ncbi:MAG: hypothetical protein ACU843_00685 [Gammaproteobacteria bacterium]